MNESLIGFVESKLNRLSKDALQRHLVPTVRGRGPSLTRGGRQFISFSCNDYLNLSTESDVIAASVKATKSFGVGAGASRLVTGDHPLYTELEARLSSLKGTEDAVVFGSGYLANAGIIPALVGAEDVIFVDELAHSCILAGAVLSRGAVHKFRHNDLDHLEKLLFAERHRAGRAMIATDGVFSMDGDLAPITELVDLSARFDAWLLTDDAHGIGVLNDGRGSAHGQGVPLQMGTLSKAVGTYGGYLCAARSVCEFIRNRARSFVYTTGLPPGTIAAAIAALDRIISDKEYCALPLRHAQIFTSALGLPLAQSPIVPIILGAADTAIAAQKLLEREGFLVTAIRPPTVPFGTARLRFAFTAQHSPVDILRLADLVRLEFFRKRAISELVPTMASV